MTTTLEGLDEDWFAEVISDSLEMDWRPRDAARLIVERMAEQFPALTALQAEVDRLREALTDSAQNCPQCDGAGSYKHQWKIVPCEFCETARTALKTGA